VVRVHPAVPVSSCKTFPNSGRRVYGASGKGLWQWIKFHLSRTQGLQVRNDTKLADLRLAMQDGDWNRALRLAARFQRLGEQSQPIRRAADAIANPKFYLQLGYDLSEIRAKGIAALKERYNKSWDSVRSKNGT
jgi:hypothetical protein